MQLPSLSCLQCTAAFSEQVRTTTELFLLPAKKILSQDIFLDKRGGHFIRFSFPPWII